MMQARGGGGGVVRRSRLSERCTDALVASGSVGHEALVEEYVGGVDELAVVGEPDEVSRR